MDTHTTKRIGNVVMDSKTNVAIVAQGREEIFSENYIPIPVGGNGYFNFTARAVGTTPSVLYFAVKCFDEDKNPITPAWSVVHCDKVLCIDCCQNSKLYMAGRVPDEWQDPYADLAFYRTDSHYDRIPDYVLGHNFHGTMGNPIFGDHNFEVMGDTGVIKLNVHLPAFILDNITSYSIRCHRSGATHVYPINSATLVPGEGAKTFSGSFSLVPKLETANEHQNVRVGTKYIKIGFLANYRGDATAVLVISDFIFSMNNY